MYLSKIFSKSVLIKVSKARLELTSSNLQIMNTTKQNDQQNHFQSEEKDKTVAQSVENTQSTKLRRRKNGQYTGSLLG